MINCTNSEIFLPLLSTMAILLGGGLLALLIIQLWKELKP